MRRIREDGERALTREPGDLPSAVVTRETRRAGCTDGLRGRQRSCAGRCLSAASFAVTCHCRCPRLFRRVRSPFPDRPPSGGARRRAVSPPCERAGGRHPRRNSPSRAKPRAQSPPSRPAPDMSAASPASAEHSSRWRRRAAASSPARRSTHGRHPPRRGAGSGAGLIVTQHSGEGKANQFFLRGFNLDHGTDIALFVDGMPVNLRTTPTARAMRPQLPDPRTRRCGGVPQGPLFRPRRRLRLRRLGADRLPRHGRQTSP